MSQGTITETALRLRAEALMAANGAPLPEEGENDARLIEAERRFRESKERRLAFSEEFKSDSEAERLGEAIWRSEEALLDAMNRATPRTRAGALAKLQVIAWRNDMGDDPELGEVIAVLERKAQP